MIDAVLAFGWLFFLDKEVKCSDLYTHECLGVSDAALVSFLFCHLATCISRFAAALCSFSFFSPGGVVEEQKVR